MITVGHHTDTEKETLSLKNENEYSPMFFASFSLNTKIISKFMLAECHMISDSSTPLNKHHIMETKELSKQVWNKYIYICPLKLNPCLENERYMISHQACQERPKHPDQARRALNREVTKS